MSAAEASDALARDAEARRVAQTEFRRPLVLEAGAGTGKTSTLVARVLAWTLGPGWERAERRLEQAGRDLEDLEIAAACLERVVAITFTESAAAEMASRAAEALVSIVEGSLPVGIERSALPESPERERRARALAAALDHLAVTTIHAWCRRLVAAHPLEIGVHPRFEVDADGRLQAEVMREVVERHLGEACQRAESPLFELLVEGVLPERIEEAIARLLEDGARVADLEADPFAPERIEAWWQRSREVLAAIERSRPALESAAAKSSKIRDLLQAIDRSQERFAGSPPTSHVDLGEVVHELAVGWTGCDDKLRSIAEDRSNGNKTLWDSVGPDDRGVLVARARALRAWSRGLGRLDPEFTERVRAALLPIVRDIEACLRARGIQRFDGLLRDARTLLVEHPEIATRRREAIDQILVDEFQDTDQIQCDVVAALAFRGETRPGLFLVGDPRQSIYGWRRADLGAYVRFVDDVRRAGGEVHALVRNFRSVPAILDEVTRVVRPVMQEEPGRQAAFQRLEPSRGPQADASTPAVEHWVICEWDAEKAEPKRLAASDASRLEAEALGRDLLARQAEGVAWSRCAVLMRSSTDIDVYLDALKRLGIPYAVEKDRRYYQRREIIDVVSLVRCVLDPNDQLALVGWLRSPAVGVPDAAWLPLWQRGFPDRMAKLESPDAPALSAISVLVGEAARAIPPEIPGLERIPGWELSLDVAVRAIAELRASFERDPADRFVEKLRTLTLVEASEAGRFLGTYRLANLDRFFRELVEVLEDGHRDPQTLIRTWRAAIERAPVEREARPKEADEEAVRFMTFHAAKGLEFDHVYLVQLAREGGGSSRPDRFAFCQGRPEYRLFGRGGTLGFAGASEEQQALADAEQVRTLYVAMTRACDRLVMSGAWPVNGDHARGYMSLLAQRELAPPDHSEPMREQAASGHNRWDDAGARWRYPTFADDVASPSGPQARPVAAVTDDELAQARSELAHSRGLAEARAGRAWLGRASDPTPVGRDSSGAAGAAEGADAHRPAGPMAGASASEAVPADEDPPHRASERARVVGIAVHRALEIYVHGADPDAELERLTGEIRPLIDHELGPSEADPAHQEACAVLARFREGPLFDRFRALDGLVVARELPVVVPPQASCEDPSEVAPSDEDPIAGFVGVIDLVHRDPETGEWIVVDYKTDRVEAPGDIEARCARYRRQGRIYRRAIREVFALESEPRFELWFLRSGQVAVLEPGSPWLGSDRGADAGAAPD